MMKNIQMLHIPAEAILFMPFVFISTVYIIYIIECNGLIKRLNEVRLQSTPLPIKLPNQWNSSKTLQAGESCINGSTQSSLICIITT